MAYPSEVRDTVRGAYVHERLPLAEAARRNDVRYETARSWKKQDKRRGDCWDMARDAARLIKGGMGEVSAGFLENFVRLFQSTVKGLEEAREKNQSGYNPIEVAEALSRLADAYVKTVRAMTHSNPKLSKLSIAYEVMEELTGFIRENYPDRLAEWVDMLEPFSRQLSEVFSK